MLRGRPRRRRSRMGGGSGSTLSVALIVLFLIAPSLLVVPLSFSDSRYLQFPPPGWSTRWYEAYFGSIEWREATYVSFAAAILTMIVSTVLGHAGRLRPAYAARPAFRGGLRSLHAAADHSRHPDRHRHLPVLRAARPQQYADRHRAGAFGGGHSARRHHGGVEPQELRHEPGDGGAQPRREPAMGISHRDAAADQDLRDLRRAAGVHHVARRGGDLAVHRRRRQGDADQAHVQCAARRDRSDHRRHLDAADRGVACCWA